MTTPKKPRKGGQCSGRVYGKGSGWTGFGCLKPATTIEDGKSWCHWHSPSGVKAIQRRAAERRRERAGQ